MYNKKTKKIPNHADHTYYYNLEKKSNCWIFLQILCSIYIQTLFKVKLSFNLRLSPPGYICSNLIFKIKPI